MSARAVLVRAATFGARQRLAGVTKLHLGCGPNILQGWANIDLDGTPPVVRLDLRKALPVESSTVRFIFCEHFIEHVTRDDGLSLLKECHRALQPGGILRLSTPDLRKVVDEYRAGRLTEWSDVGWQPATPCQMLNEGLRLWGHEFVYDPDEIRLLLGEAGFTSLAFASWRQSEHLELRDLESRPYHGEIIVEATF